MASTNPSSSSSPSSSPTGPLVPQPSRPTPPAPSGLGNQNDFPPGTAPSLTSSAGLYLYTFLATLVLLLLVSATIIFRSWALRRHHRALIAEAIANGTYVPPGKARDVGDRPKMYEVFIGDTEALTARGEGPISSEKEKQREEGNLVGGSLVVEWDNMVPISGVHLNAPERPIAPPPPPPPPAPTPPPPARFRWPRWLTRSQPPILPTAAPGPSAPPSPTSPTRTRPFSWQSARTSHSATLTLVSEKLPVTPEPPPETVRVAVLISMPFADRGRRPGAEDEGPELPHMEIGVVELGADGLADGMEVELEEAAPSTPGLSIAMLRSHSRLPQVGRTQSRVAGSEDSGRLAAVS